MAEMKYRKQILKGFQLLDKKKPGWKVDLRKLNMAHSCKCTVGQNYSGFITGLSALDILRNPTSYGFSFKDNLDWSYLEDEYKTLTKEVKILIKEWRKK